MKLTIMILSIFLFLSILNSLNGDSILNSLNGDSIKYIAVNYVGLRIHTQTDLSLDLFLDKNSLRYIQRDTITSDSLLGLFEEEFNKFTTPVYIDNCNDFRLVALVFRKSGRLIR
ncbi:MAG: hypothetical protein KGZ71_10370 [Desulfobulbaceae bacterium]|nr:hypothetical protein [Desulfobulbaceae bacterium]